MAALQQPKAATYKTIAPFLQTHQGKLSRLFGYIGLGIGLFLLLVAMQFFLNIQNLLKDHNIRKEGFDFISVTKTITNQNMGKNNRITLAEIEDLKTQKFIADAAPLISNQFRAKVSAGSIIPFSTDVFLESIQNNFLDTLPSSFTWQPGQQNVPIIFSADYLEMYNIFAPTQGMPQLSAATASSVNIFIDCYGPNGPVTYQAGIVGFSHRINSILVPINFLNWANNHYGSNEVAGAARVYIKTTDANNPQLLEYLQKNNFQVNKEKTKFGRIKKVLQAVVSGLGVFAVLIILLSMLLFSFYLQLMIAKSKDHLALLLTLGYSPAWLSKKVAQRWIPIYSIIFMAALLLVQVAHYLFLHIFSTSNQISWFISGYVLLLAGILLLLCIFINHRLIKKAVSKI